MNSKRSVAIVGPGAIGTVCIGALHKSVSLTVCARTAVESIRLETPQGVMQLSPRMITNPCDAQKVDVVLLSTKAHQTDAAGFCGEIRWIYGWIYLKNRFTSPIFSGNAAAFGQRSNRHAMETMNG